MRRWVIPLGILALVMIGVFTVQLSPLDLADLKAKEAPLTESESRLMAEYAVKASSTYALDGKDLKFYKSETLKCPYCWSHEFYYLSEFAGYGNEADRVELIRVDTPHVVTVVVNDKKVVSIDVDKTWDELEKVFI